MKNRLYLAFDEYKTLTEWVRDDRCVVKYSTLQKRITKYNWGLEKALITKLRKTPTDLVGKIFGKLKVIKKSSKESDNKDYWECKCECGKTTTVLVHSIISGHTKSCGCLLKEVAKENGKKRGIGKGLAAKNSTLQAYKRGAKNRGIKWSLLDSEFFSLTSQNCYYCGDKPSNIKKGKTFVGDFTYSGIDRVDSKLGYEINNCVPCCAQCNYSKRSLPQLNFYNWVVKVYKNLNDKNKI